MNVFLFRKKVLDFIFVEEYSRELRSNHSKLHLIKFLLVLFVHAALI